MRSSIFKAAIASALGFVANAQVSRHCVTTDVCYRLNIPTTTASGNSGNVYFSISGPTSYSWIALGQGSNGMSNANVFIIYQNGNGNVTLSARHSSSEVMPTYSSAIDAELLAGSGVSNGVMTANIRCGNCQSWGTSGRMDFSGSSAGFIHARLSGSSLSSTSVSRSLSQHSSDGDFTWSFASAVGGSSSNPFVTTTSTSGNSSSTGTSSGSSSSGTSSSNSGSNSGSSSTTTTTDNSGSGSSGDSNNDATILLLHGILASVAFVALLPFGGILIRVANFPSLIWIHAGIQMLGWLCFTVAFALGVYYGVKENYMTETHPIIGIVLMVLMVFQPVFGWLHHRRFARTGARSSSSHLHIWVGRVAIILGIVNGGLGMQLSGVTRTYTIVYSVFAGIFGVAYLGAIAFGEMKRKSRVNSTATTRSGEHEMLSSKERSEFKAPAN